MSRTRQEKNKALVLEAFDTLFNKLDYVAAERYWSPDHIQHSAHIARPVVGVGSISSRAFPQRSSYEPETIVAGGDFLIVPGRLSDFGLPVNWIAADILCIKGSIVVEHGDVIQDEASREQSKSGLPTVRQSFHEVKVNILSSVTGRSRQSARLQSEGCWRWVCRLGPAPTPPECQATTPSFLSIGWLQGKKIGGLSLYPEKNRFDRAKALDLYTVGSSWFSTEDGKKGSLAPGQLADLAVLSSDYFSIPEEEIKNLESVLTIVGGKIVYAAGEYSNMAPPALPVSPDWSPMKQYGGYAPSKGPSIAGVAAC